jgi:hypothetical protein
MRARGLSIGEIAHELQLLRASISSNMQYLREQAKGSIRECVTEYLPEQYQQQKEKLALDSTSGDSQLTTKIGIQTIF